MKLRNKKTSEIGELKPFLIDEKISVWIENKSNPEHRYKSLAELNDEWEDYEEPKEHWYINYQGEIYVLDPKAVPEYSRNAKEIGNYFETKEEAEKAVEKLKAWKRLKEAGAKFYGWRRNQTGTYELYMRWYDRIPRSYEVKKDLDLLFGGVE